MFLHCAKCALLHGEEEAGCYIGRGGGLAGHSTSFTAVGVVKEEADSILGATLN